MSGGDSVTFKDVRLVYPLPDGGRVEVTDDALVPMGDVYAHRQVTYRNGSCTIVFEVRDGVPGAASVELAGETFIGPKDLMSIKLDRLCKEAFAVTGAFVPSHDGGSEVTYEVVRNAVSGARRNKITPEFLAKVAQVHNDAPEGTRTNAVVEAFNCKNQRTAFRYIAAAKERNLIHGND
jgi:hypothetical protein